MLNILHVLALFGVLLLWNNLSVTNTDLVTLLSIVGGVAIIYILSIGVLATLITINERLGKIVELLNNKDGGNNPHFKRIN
jgi:hypothetical protein|tara:strand:+ start:1237 stop:1479 length:243 start_codon:yes stop_codon:yes gene_type:complete